MKITISSMALLFMLGAGLVVDAEGEDFKSGLQPGDLATPFEVKDITGPNKGVTLCYR